MKILIERNSEFFRFFFLKELISFNSFFFTVAITVFFSQLEKIDKWYLSSKSDCVICFRLHRLRRFVVILELEFSLDAK